VDLPPKEEGMINDIHGTSFQSYKTCINNFRKKIYDIWPLTIVEGMINDMHGMDF
jgi:hypothetical protein